MSSNYTYFFHYTPFPRKKQEEILNKEFFHKGLEIGESDWYNIFTEYTDKSQGGLFSWRQR